MLPQKTFTDTSTPNKAAENKSLEVKKPNLPQGGGAITGFGEHYQTNGFTGTASLKFGGLQYNSGSGNGPFGMGFGATTAPGISRRTSFGTPSYIDTEDTFLWGGEVLVPQLDDDGVAIVQSGALEGVENDQWIKPMTPATGDYQVRLYQHRKESGFAQIQYWTWNANNAPDGEITSFWRIIEKDNSEHLFGVSTEAQVVNPANPDQVYKWLHQESLDAQGHGTYLYYLAENTDNVDTQSTSEANRVQTAQKYLWRICSGHATPLDQALSFLSNSQRSTQEPDWYFETLYDYGQYDLDPANTDPYDIPKGNTWSTREDSFSNYLPGFEIRTHRLCQNVMKFHRFTSLNAGTPVLTHVFRYHYKTSPICSLLSTVEDIAYYLRNGSYETQYNPPLEISYNQFDPSAQEYREILESVSLSPFPGVGNGLPFVPVDLYNEGIEGFLYSDGISDYYLKADWGAINNDEADRPLTFSKVDIEMPLPVGRLQNGVNRTLTDITANGQLDYLITSDAMVGYFEVEEDETWGSFIPLSQFPTEYRNPRHHMVDVTGDGINDCLMMTDQGLRFYRSLREEGYDTPVMIDIADLPTDFPISWDSSERIFFTFTDIDGGGKSHLVKVTQEGLTYWPNVSYGHFGESIQMENFPSLTYDQFKEDRILFADVDGSGTADMIVLFSDKIAVYLNQCGNSFADPIELPLPTGEVFDPLDRIFFADVYGTGMSCLIYSTTHPYPKQWCYQLSGGLKPYLLNSFDNNVGGKSSIEYKSSVHYYLKDQAAGEDWITHAPFSVHVVASVTASDEISGSVMTSTKSYRHSYYDGDEREFRGFGYTESEDIQVFDEEREIYDSYPAKTKTWYRTGSPDQNTITKQYQEEYYSEDILPVSAIDYNGYTDLEGNSEIEREAQLVLSGTMLRQEVYGDDDTANADTPYSVIENNQVAKVLQPKDKNEYASFQILPRESLNYHYERHPEDAMIEHHVALQFDDYGHVTQSCSITYPRNPKYVDALDQNKEQSKVRCHSQTNLYYNLTKAAKQIDSDYSQDELYLLGVPFDNRKYHIANLSEVLGELGYNEIYAFDDLHQYLAANTPSQSQLPFASTIKYTLRAWEKTKYYYATNSSDGSGEVAPQDSKGQIYLIDLSRTSSRAFLLPYQSLHTAFVQAELETLFSDFFTSQDFSQLMGGTDNGAYLADENNTYWWVPSGVHTYQSASSFYLPKAYTDPHGSTSTFTYDDYNLIQLTTSDALGNTVTAKELDYQTLHPYVVQDPNGNSAEVLYDARGRVIASSHYGTQTPLGESDPTELGFDSLYGKNPYEVQRPNSMSDILASPYTYLQNAASYFYYDRFSWMGQVTEQDYLDQVANIDQDTLDNWWQAQMEEVFINPQGALYAAYRQVIEASSSATDFTTTLGKVSSSLQEAFEKFSTSQQSSIFNLLNAAISATATSPIHALALSAEDYPSDSQARLTTEDYNNAISNISSSDLSTWLSQLKENKLIDDNDVFSGTYRSIVQSSTSSSDFESQLNKISTDLGNAFAAFAANDHEKQVYQLQKTALYQRINQVISYSDGFGRNLQIKTKAESGSDSFLYNSDGSISKNSDGQTISDRWLTSGHKVYNNKGQVVRQYEPYYINTTAYVSDDELNQLGASPTNFYDPLGRVYQVYTNKGFLVRKVWTPWSLSTWDTNDALPFSPFYLVNEQNILNGDTSPPAKGSTYYAYRHYFNQDMTQEERNTYQTTLLMAWTPTKSVNDNRGLTLWSTQNDVARFTATTFTQTFPNNGTGIYQNLITVGYLETKQSAETVRGNGDSVRKEVEWAQLTTAFPFPQLPLSETEYQVQAPGILSILYQNKLDDTAVSNSAFTSLGYTNATSQALWTALEKDAGILDSDGMVTSKLSFPKLTGLDSDYQAQNNAIVTLMMAQWAAAYPLRSFKTFDSFGRTLTQADPRLTANEQVNITYTYPTSMGGKIVVDSCDAGQKWAMVDVIGRPLWQRDQKGYVRTFSYDKLHRPTATFVAYQQEGKTSVSEGPIAVQRMLYGESADSPEDYNLRGKMYQHFDQAEWTYLKDGYTINGKPQGGVSQLTKAYQSNTNEEGPQMPLLEVPELSATVNSLPYDTSQLQSTLYTNQAKYDAIGRLTQRVDTAGNTHYPFYHESGNLKQQLFNSIPYVNKLVYNAKGQRTQSEYNSSASQLVFQTFNIYDAKNYRNIQLFSTTDADFSWTDENELIPTSKVDDQTRQNLVYTFDPIGNITQLNGSYQGPAASQSELSDTQSFSANGAYWYDGCYRMVRAQGMEQDPSSNTPTLAQYQRDYGYDDGYNLTWMQHTATASGQQTTTQMYTGADSNRAIDESQYDALSSSQQADLDATILSAGLMDVHGNLLANDENTPLVWNFQNHIQSVTNTGDNQTKVVEYYVYGSNKKRSRKITETYTDSVLTQLEVVSYLDVEYRSLWTGSALHFDGENVTDGNGNTVKPQTAYQSNRIRLGHQQVARYDVYQYQKGKAVSSDNTQTVFFVDSHIDSCQLLLDSNGDVLSYEEFYPYGGSSFSTGSSVPKHYRYSGQERDQTNFYYYGMRYYAGARFRWLSPDPAGFVESMNRYAMVGGNPVTHRDVMGLGGTLNILTGRGMERLTYHQRGRIGYSPYQVHHIPVVNRSEHYSFQERQLVDGTPQQYAIIKNNNPEQRKVKEEKSNRFNYDEESGVPYITQAYQHLVENRSETPMQDGAKKSMTKRGDTASDIINLNLPTPVDFAHGMIAISDAASFTIAGGHNEINKENVENAGYAELDHKIKNMGDFSFEKTKKAIKTYKQGTQIRDEYNNISEEESYAFKREFYGFVGDKTLEGGTSAVTGMALGRAMGFAAPAVTLLNPLLGGMLHAGSILMPTLGIASGVIGVARAGEMYRTAHQHEQINEGGRGYAHDRYQQRVQMGQDMYVNGMREISAYQSELSL